MKLLALYLSSLRAGIAAERLARADSHCQEKRITNPEIFNKLTHHRFPGAVIMFSQLPKHESVDLTAFPR
jgi:hypothetical protein